MITSKICIDSHLSQANTIAKIEGLLQKRSIGYVNENNRIQSKKIPLTILGFDPRLYSKNNWVGINPFVFLSSIEITIDDKAYQNVNIIISRFRSFVILFLAFTLSSYVAIKMPVFWIGLIISTSVSLIVFLFLFVLCTALIKTEVRNVLRVIT